MRNKHHSLPLCVWCSLWSNFLSPNGIKRPMKQAILLLRGSLEAGLTAKCFYDRYVYYLTIFLSLCLNAYIAYSTPHPSIYCPFSFVRNINWFVSLFSWLIAATASGFLEEYYYGTWIFDYFKKCYCRDSFCLQESVGETSICVLYIFFRKKTNICFLWFTFLKLKQVMVKNYYFWGGFPSYVLATILGMVGCK